MKSRVLIVDDNSANLQLAVNTLICDEIQLLAAKSGADALAILEQNEIDLVLLDIEMPDMDGFQVFENIKALPGHSEVPIIFLTSHNDSDIFKRCFATGGVDFISKPFNTEELQARVTTHLDLSQHRRNLQSLVDERTAMLQDALEKVKSSEAAKESFLSMMSHELRTPLNGIMGMTQLLRNADFEEMRDDLLNDLDTSANRLNQLLSEILNFVNIDKSIDQSYSAVVDMLTFKEQLELMFLQFCEEQKKFELNFSEDIPADLKMDKGATTKAVECFVSNAFKFSDEGVVTLNVFFKNEGDRPSLIFEVIDEGIGIAPQHFERIYDKFYQIDSGMNRRYGGAGIGLTFARKLIDSMQGTVEIQSTIGEGSTFRIEIPVLQAANDEFVKIKDIRHVRALIVEDIMMNQDYLRRVLEMIGVKVLAAKGYTEAMKILDNEEVDVIFMDYMLPDKNGAEITAELREDPDFHSLPIIGVTAKVDVACQQECFMSGMNEFMTKPFTAKEIFATLGHYYDMQQSPLFNKMKKAD